MGYRVVVAGATGNVGREMLNILAEREFPADEIAAVASSRSTGDEIRGGFKVPNYVDEIQDFERANAGLMPEKCMYSSLSCTLNWSADRILSGLVDGNSPADE